ncbi:MAG: UDP-N-acetylmuramate dehydrogenase [Alphaproteobacteria bacterium]|nr:UDP-N-acetylmuramate dehydrogenase [Alphaproteobacteria bacterium]
MPIRINEPLSKHTRFATGGPADIFFEPADENELIEFLHAHGDTPITVLGLGSNVLVRDGGIRGAVIKLSSPYFKKIEVAGDTITAYAGAPNILVANAATDAGLSGFEFLALIPGTIGGAIPTNAGCFGQDISGVLQEVEVLDLKTLEKKILTHEELNFGYRHSGLDPESRLILKATMKGTPEAPEKISATIAANKAQKSATQPVAEKTAGSTFKNPSAPNPPAYKLIQDVGLQGVEIDGAKFSPLHANFLINTGTANSAALENLIELAQQKVKEKFNITLEPEIKILGEK